VPDGRVSGVAGAATLSLNNGVELPSLGLGVFQIPPEETASAVEVAISAGYRLIDTAAVIGNEREVGEGIRHSGIDRSQLFVTSKLWISDYGYEGARRGYEGCLKRLGLEYLDLFLLHGPVPVAFGTTVAAFQMLERLYREGQVRAIGVSNFNSQQLTELMRRTNVVPAVNQVEVHPFFTQQALCDFHTRHTILTQAWSPLGGVIAYGQLAAKGPIAHPTITKIAAGYGKTTAQVVLRWHLDQGRSVIPKSARSQRIKENAAIFDFHLTQAEIAAVNVLDTGIRGGPDPDSIDHKHYPFQVEN
jgi:2,5-diketo-D-gluconate reductase A